MLLFLISFLLVFASSYFLTSILAPKKSILGVVYLLLIAFAQIVVTFESLSIFSAIVPLWVLATNLVFFLISGIIWNSKFRPLWSLEFEGFRHRVTNSFKLDKALVWLFVAFVFFLIISLLLCLVMPLTSPDAQAYHAARSVFWVLQGSLNHFDTSDVRNLCLPINSEILYSWVLLFTKKALFFAVFSFVGFVLSLISLYNIMGYMAFSTRKKLWALFVLSSFPSVLVQASGTETDLIIAGLLTSSVCLFWYAIKNNKLAPVFMSALAYALAIGTKTTAIIAIPGVGLLFLALSLYYKQIKLLGYFLFFGIFNFLIFSSYNYILNFIQFGNFMGSQSFMIVSKNYYGIKGAFANFIKYMFVYFDFTGFRWADYLGDYIVNLRASILSSLGLSYVPDGLYSFHYEVNRTLIEQAMGAGILGLLVYLPCLIWSLIKPIFKSKSRKIWFIFSFALLYIINIFVMSYLLAYMSYSIRFIMFFMVLSSPILGYSYIKKKSFIKNIIVFFAVFSLVFISSNLWARPMVKIVRILKMDPSISNLRYRALCTDYNKYPSFSNPACALRVIIEKRLPHNSKILAFIPDSNNIFMLKTLEYKGYNIDFRLMEDLSKIDLDNYDAIITTTAGQRSTYMKYYAGVPNRYIYDNGIQVVKCSYGQNRALINIDDSNDEVWQPFQVTCKINKQYLEHKHFKLFDEAGVYNLVQNLYTYYLVYKKAD